MPVPNHSYHDHTAVEDLLDRPPGWLLRSGIGVLFLFTAVFFGLAALIRYPDQLNAPCILQTEIPPVPLRFSNAAVLDTLLVSDGARVNSGQRLARLQTAGDWHQIDRLDQWVQRAEAESTTPNVLSLPPSLHHLGELQVAYDRVWSSSLSLQDFLALNGIGAELRQRKREIASSKRLISGLDKQLDLFGTELGLQSQQTQRDSLLATEGIISQLDWEQSTKTDLAARRQRESLRTTGVQGEIRIDQLRREIVTLTRNHQIELNRLRREAGEALRELRAELDRFQQRYVLTSPIAGIVSWQDDLVGRSVITTEQPVGYLVPASEQNAIVVRATLPADASGKIHTGQPLYISLSNFPAREFGQLPGKVAAIAPLALTDAEGSYGIQVQGSLDQNLQTTYGKRISFRQNSTGNIAIITEDRSLLGRVFDRLTDITKNY